MMPGEIRFPRPIQMGPAGAHRTDPDDCWFVIGPSGAIVEAGPAADREAARIGAEEQRLREFREAQRLEAQVEIDRAEAYERARDAEFERMQRRTLGLPD